MISIILIAHAESNGLLPEPIVYSPVERISVYLFFFVLAMILQIISARNAQQLIKQVQTSEIQYKSLLENIPATTYIDSIHSNAATEYVSPQVEKLLGYPRNDFLNDPLLWTKILHPHDAEKVMIESRRTSESREPFEMEYRLIAKDKSVVWVRDEAALVRNDNDEPMYWLGVWTDITSRKQAEEQQASLISMMTKRTTQLQTAAEVSRAASSILDLNILLPNAVELIRNHFEYYYVGIFLVEETREWAVLSAATGEMGRHMLKTGHRLKVKESSMIGWCIGHGEARIALDVGEDAVRFVNPHLPLTRSEIALPLITHGDVIGAMTIQSDVPAAFSRVDITALQTMADQIANAIENARLFTERIGLINELEAQNAELERFTYTVSHDLRSPLVTIRGFLGYLRQDAASGDMERFEKDLKRIANAVDKMQTLLNELLELSRIGRIANPPEDVLFEDIIKDVKEMLSGSIEAGNIKLEVSGKFPVVNVDRLRMTEVVQNLVSNAIKFMGNQPHPTIHIGMNGVDVDDKLIFYVQDNGVGIEPQYHERIFGLFNRLNPNVEGTGIGLTLVRRIIEIHGGRIWVESDLGKGATFFFTLANADKN
jgi:PAS domain S-box-containing protein